MSDSPRSRVTGNDHPGSDGTTAIAPTTPAIQHPWETMPGSSVSNGAVLDDRHIDNGAIVPSELNGDHLSSPSHGQDDPTVTPTTTASDSVRRVPRITIEAALYALLLLAACLTRFWDLGSRTLHHDESLHSYYSWLYATGQGYSHDPLMHGPFLFHANALVYLLFGASDATSRYMPALFGAVLVGLPYFLRGPRHLGRWGALMASAFFLVSPTILYQSRYIRHDIYTVVGSLILVIGIMRYIERPERRWLVTAGAAVGLLLTNHEIIFGIGAIFVAILWGALLWRSLRPLLPLHIAAAVVAAALVMVRPGPFSRSFPEIPWDRDGSNAPQPTRAHQMDYYAELLQHPLVIALVVLALVVVAAAAIILARRWNADQTPGLIIGSVGGALAVGALWVVLVLLLNDGPAWRPVAALVIASGALAGAGWLVSRGRQSVDPGNRWLDALFGAAPRHSVDAAVAAAGRDVRGIGLALGVAASIFVALYTSLFTNIHGILTGTTATDGTLLYWLGQQGERRGEQPWFYFLLLMPQYEFLAFLLGGAAVVAVAVAVLRATRYGESHSRLFFQLFLAIWFAGIFAALSYAGEKMPWLVVHITLPAILLAAGLVGQVAERVAAWRSSSALRWSRTETLLTTSLLTIGGAWLLLAGRMSYGSFVPGGDLTRVVTPDAADHWWWLAIPPAAAAVAIAIGVIGRGYRRAGSATFAALAIGLVLLQIHAGWRTTYQEGDVPKDMLVYTQTAPDVSRMVRELGELSAETTGGKDLDIWYDGYVSWPLQWYLRDFPNHHYYTTLTEPPSNAAVVIAQNDRKSAVEPYLKGYTPQEYVLRWWFPEYPIYRNFAIAPELRPGASAWETSKQPHGLGAIVGSVVDSFATQLSPEGQQQVYRLLMYRDLPAPIESYRYTIYVRNDLLPLLNQIRY